MASSEGVFGGGQWLKAADLEKLVESQESFAIVGITPVQGGQFGDETVYEIEFAGDDATVYLTFGWSESRERDAHKHLKALEAADDGRLEPCYLWSVKTKAGKNARVLRAEPQVAEDAPAPVKAAGKGKGKAAPAADADDDGIPF